MQTFKSYILPAICVLLSLSSCNDEPDPTIKPAEERTVLLLTGEGHIYNQAGEKIMELPNCEYASEIISDGDDYFVSGKCTKDRVGYWKNGKWNTLHVDFIEDVEHETQGIGKWDYYIYMLDYPNILKNSGIFPLEDCEDFTAPSKCMSVSEGKCYVVGTDYHLEDGEFNDAVLYYEHKGHYAKEILPKPEGVNAGAFTIFAWNATRTVIGGRVGDEPCLWIDKQLQMLPRTFDVHDESGLGLPVAAISSVTCTKDHIYAAGSENDTEGNEVATLWVDGVPQHLLSGDEGLYWSWITEIISYGDDWYALSIEMVKKSDGDTDVNILVWFNGTIIGRYHGIDIVNIAVL
ncbi:MAG: hypothetical protein J6X81_05820 [Muribaculaceae bacterium]|nr:hypothetical protein [Muribaculaceae bacterium]